MERVAAAGQKYADAAMDILDRPANPDPGYEGWLVGLMIVLAGELRLEPAVPLVYRQFEVDWDWYNDEILYALAKIGTPSVLPT